MSQDRSFLDADVAEVVSNLSVSDKIALLGAPNWWNTTKVANVPSVRMSDGPNGVRGSSHFSSTPAQCIPCATSLASTFDTDLIKQVGVFLAEEAKVKSATILLAPTCNIQRSPLGGRAFESFSEDPHLSGSMAAAYVNGLQSKGVGATIKHFVGNEQEHERTAVDSIIPQRALREIYLYPFMLAQRDAKPWAYMTSYGRLNGLHCPENPTLLRDILRGDWGFDGLVMSDWYGTYSVDGAINAGLDLEMPGPPRWRNPLLVNHCLTSRKLLPSTLDERAENILRFVQKVARASPEVVYGDGIERSKDTPESRAFCRKIAAEGMILLKNNGGVLPITDKVKKIAVIGPNAQGRVISGGGSAYLKATYIINPWEGLVAHAPQGTTVEHSVGCYAHRYLPTLEDKLTTPNGEEGWLCTFYAHDEQDQPTKELESHVLRDTRVKLNDFLPSGLTPNWSIKLRGALKVPRTAPFEFGLTVAGRAKLYVNGKLTIDNWTKQRAGDFFYGQGTAEEVATIPLEANKPYDILVEYTNTLPPDVKQRPSAQPALMRGVRLGGAEKIDPDGAIEDAVKLATSSDVAVLVVGLSSEWESEGFDRPTMDMPGRQNELISRIAKANPNTVVCIQAGSAVSMPWAGEVAGIVQTWLSGNEAGNALADILYGKVNPSGRLPLTLPVKEEDIPAHLNFRSENGKVHYTEGIFVGYKHYQGRGIKPLFPFGFGLSYTTFELSNLAVSKPSENDANSFALDLSVTVTNTGSVIGSEVVQVYVSLPDLGITHPKLQLRAFAKVKDLKPGKSEKVKLHLNKYAVSFWDESIDKWKAEKGEYVVFVGTSSEHLPLQSTFEVGKTFVWTGL